MPCCLVAKIKHPREHQKVPHDFFASGITNLTDPTKLFAVIRQNGIPYQGQLVIWRPSPKLPGRFCWAVRFSGVPNGVYTLVVTGQKQNGQNVVLASVDNFTVVPARVGGPTITYPTTDEDISPEKSDLYAYGTDTNPVTSVTVTPDGGSPISCDYLYTDAANNYWAAHFDLSDVAGPIGLTFEVDDNQNANITQTAAISE